MQYPRVPRHQLQPLEAILYTPGGFAHPIEYTPTAADHFYMGLALDEAEQAAANNDSPIGVAIKHSEFDEPILARTTEFTDDDLTGHAEINGIRAAREKIGRFLGQCMMYTTAEPCPGCAYFLGKGQVGMVIVGASREDAPEFFRKRNTTLDDVWRDTRHPLTIVKGLRKVEAAQLLTADAKRH